VKLLLDAHAAIWFFNGDAQLSKKARSAILAPTNEKHLSIASVWEVAIKISVGKLHYAPGSEGFANLALSNGFVLLPIKPEHLAQLESLPFVHRDPFDRLLVATAQTEKLQIVSADYHIAQYDVRTLW
jgi:PIN domain nuclease of toxin-antitoxin system